MSKKADRFRHLRATPLPPEGHKLDVLSQLTGEDWSANEDNAIHVSTDADMCVDVNTDVNAVISTDVDTDNSADIDGDADITTDANISADVDADINTDVIADVDVTMDADVSADTVANVTGDSETDAAGSADHGGSSPNKTANQETLANLYADVLGRARYTDLHVRVTWYVERDLARIVDDLHALGIPKSRLINDALRMYLREIGCLEE